jgi:hypothetical protein
MGGESGAGIWRGSASLYILVYATPRFDLPTSLSMFRVWSTNCNDAWDSCAERGSPWDFQLLVGLDVPGFPGWEVCLSRIASNRGKQQCLIHPLPPTRRCTRTITSEELIDVRCLSLETLGLNDTFCHSCQRLVDASFSHVCGHGWCFETG